jgi:hypothetical protein
VEDAMLALAAVEEVFRLTPMLPGARQEAKDGSGIAVLGPEVDRLLVKCLQGYSELFSRRVRTLRDAVHYGGLLQDAPYDDVTMLGISRKQVVR